MKKLAIILVLSLTSCVGLKATTTEQAYFALKSDYKNILELAVAYKENCKFLKFQPDCEDNIAKIRQIDGKVSSSFALADSYRNGGLDTKLSLTIASIEVLLSEFSNLVEIKQ